MKQTKLLTYIMEEAETLAAADGRRELTADFFLLAAMGALSRYRYGALPNGLQDEVPEAEVADALALLSLDEGEWDSVREKLRAGIAGDLTNRSMDELVFTLMAGEITAKTEGEGDGVVDTAAFLKLLFGTPTDNIRQNLLDRHAAPATKAPETPETTEALETAETTEAPAVAETSAPAGVGDLSSLNDQVAALFGTPDGGHKKKKTPARADEGASAPAVDTADTPPAEELTGVKRLADTVRRTREIQNRLLDTVFGQDQAVTTFVSGYFQAELVAHTRGDSGKPQASFLFAGPPGVGKTFLAEQAAAALGLPYRRFDMSEYADKEANLELCGADEVYKNSKPGNLTGFVQENPRCVLLFDEIEKAHINAIHLFLQILDAGRLRDNYTDKEVSFSRAILIFTTNVGKNLYSDPSLTNLANLPRKKILRALAADVDPATGVPLFPAAICSRFASGNVVMFNHLGAGNLFTIARRELDKSAAAFAKSIGIQIEMDEKVPAAILLSEGGRADARTVKGRAGAFLHGELYELLRLLASGDGGAAVEGLETVEIRVRDEGKEITPLFTNPNQPAVLVFAEGAVLEECQRRLRGVTCYAADDLETAKEILFNRDIAAVLCDVTCKNRNPEQKLLNAEDIRSAGQDFLSYVLSRYTLPVYLLCRAAGDISREEFLSFAQAGVREVLAVEGDSDFGTEVLARCDAAYRQANMIKLARENKVLSYKTAQTLSPDGRRAAVELFDFRLTLAADAEDSKNLLDAVSRPALHFADVIGAADAKEELAYFVEYLKDPVRYMRRGVRAPKGILLYGPPGTGKTMLARAMAGESDVTFLTAEGNAFLKKYVGEGATAVHDLFRAARKYAPAILFVDEIDAIGRDRAADTHNTSSDVLTAFLTEMDGFHTDTSKPVFVLAATNYAVEPGKGKSLDPALLRRFDRRIYVDLPNKEERRRFLEMKMAKNPAVALSAEEVENVAIRSTGMSLADLDSIFEMALRSALRAESGAVGDAAFEEAFETFHGGARKTWNPDTLTRTARHEAGHALLCWLSGETPSYLTVVARGDHGGYMQHADGEDKPLYTKRELLARIRTALGGRAAELVYYGEEEGISTGAGGDLRSATAMAEGMLCHYGMDRELGLACVSETAGAACYGEVRRRVNTILQEQLEAAVSACAANRAAIDAMVEALTERNHLRGPEIEAIFAANVKP